MISLSECRRILGSTARELSDAEVLSIRDALRGLAEIALESLTDPIGSEVNCYPLPTTRKPIEML
jgi:hypothetical protein